jgi:prepilin-type N-terminal cleavage/methylation domain-containing protein
MKMLKKKGGFTLVEIMIVVAIIGLLAAIAIPNFMKARETAQKNVCIANMKQIDGAKTLYALDEGTDAAAVSDLTPDYIKAEPFCPMSRDEDGELQSYILGDADEVPSCPVVATYEDHVLE